MQRSNRQKLIFETVNSGPRSIDALAEMTGASSVSIRRDRVELADQGAIRRIRGCATPMPHRGADYAFALQQASDIDLKQALAMATAELIEPGESVFIDNGTTALAIAKELSGKGQSGMAASLHSASTLARKPGNQVVVPGGLIDHDDQAFASAQRVLLASTADKFNHTAALRSAFIADLGTIITTQSTPGVTAEAHIAGVTVIEAEESSVNGKRPRVPLYSIGPSHWRDLRPRRVHENRLNYLDSDRVLAISQSRHPTGELSKRRHRI